MFDVWLPPAGSSFDFAQDDRNLMVACYLLPSTFHLCLLPSASPPRSPLTSPPCARACAVRACAGPPCRGIRRSAAPCSSARPRGVMNPSSDARSRGRRAGRSLRGSRSIAASTRNDSGGRCIWRRSAGVSLAKHPSAATACPTARRSPSARTWLAAEFALLRPELVIPVGRLAIVQLHPARAADGDHRSDLPGELCADHECDVIPLPHPSGASPWPRIEPGRKA